MLTNNVNTNSMIEIHHNALLIQNVSGTTEILKCVTSNE